MFKHCLVQCLFKTPTRYCVLCVIIIMYTSMCNVCMLFVCLNNNTITYPKIIKATNYQGYSIQMSTAECLDSCIGSNKGHT